MAYRYRRKIAEMAEACAAISAGDKNHAKQELAQVCAVAIRMMHRLDATE